jgi:hypothetical protein
MWVLKCSTSLRMLSGAGMLGIPGGVGQVQYHESEQILHGWLCLTFVQSMLYFYCRGQSSAPCRVIVWLRPVQFYIPGKSFSKAANVSGFFCV